MRVFHFMSERYGLDNLRRRRLKVATLNELNDPFELFGVNLTDATLRRALRASKEEFAKSRGLLCFSRYWHNPVLWSHYAGRHTGLCFGFDVADDHLHTINYTRKRVVVELEQLHHAAMLDSETVEKLLFTKYAHWKYESEVRSFITLGDKDPETGLYFVDFSDDLRLAEVIVGAQSSVTREALRDALGQLASTTEVFKTRLAFRTFRVVRQRDTRLWV